MMNKKSKLAKRYQESYASKGNGATRTGVMDYKKVDDEVTFFSPSEGKNRINIIPYIIKTKNHPLVKRGEFEIGDSDYVMDIFTHRGIGASESTVLCLKNTYGKPCPICEQSAILRKQGKEDEANALKPSRRVFYNIEDLKEPGKIKVFETSHFLFEKELIDEARDDEEGGFVDFADPEDGKEIKFRCQKTKKGGFEFNEFKSFGFDDRDEPIDDDLLNSAISFDEIMNIPTYEDVEKVLYGNDDDEETEEKFSKKKSYDDDEDDFEEDEKPAKKSSKKEVDEDDFDDEDDEPKSKKKVEDDEEPEEKSSKGGCPHKHKFGTDCDEYEECDDCDCWDKCVKAN